MEEIAKALELKRELDVLRPLDKDQEDRIMQKFRLDWNYHSNNLEGNSLTYGETKALLMFGVTAQGKPLKDHFEVTGHNEAINWVIDMVKGERPLTENFIRELHQLLLKEPYEVDAQTPDGQPTKKMIKVGSYKTTPNHVKTVTGEVFYFATPEETPAKMADLMDWYNEAIEKVEINPILLAAEFHYKFIRIHPFDDGNGRTARILMNFVLMKYGYPHVIIKTEDKANYFAALRLADAGNIEAFVDYIAKNLNYSLEIMIAGAKGESIEEPDDIDKEIALLDKKLSSLGEKAKVEKNNKDVTNIVERDLQLVYEKIIEKTGKLNEYYTSHSYVLSPIKEIEECDFYTPDQLLKKYSLKLFEAEELLMQIIFSEFSLIGLQKFDYVSNITISFSSNYYSVYSENKLLLQKPYGEKMKKEEIEIIAIFAVKRHKNFIEQKIAEKENQSF